MIKSCLSFWLSALAALAGCAICIQPLAAQDVNVESQDDSAGVSFTKPVTQKWKVGARIRAANRSVRSAYITIPVPMDWPEQSVKVVEEKIPDNVTGVKYRVLNDGVRQILANVVNVKPGEQVEMSVTFEVTVSQIEAPKDTSKFVKPKRPSRNIKAHLNRSPQINHGSMKLRNQVKEIVKDIDEPWKQVEALYDWVRENIKQINEKPEGAQSCLRHLKGPPEDMVSLFIAFCRANKVPARTVWVEGHVYAEFYLEDEEKKGHWFPAQLAGNRDFGSMSDPRIIQQKGDNIKVPEEEKRQRYVYEHVTAKTLAPPTVKFIRQLIQK